MNFSLDLTFSDDVLLREGTQEDHFGVESYNAAAPSQNVSLQSHFSQLVDASIFDQAFVEGDQTDQDNTLNGEPPESQNILDYSAEIQSSQVEVVAQTIDDVDISKAAPSEETSPGIVANSSTSVLMMSDEPSRVTTFHHFSSSNHISFAVKLEKCLDEAQKSNLERILRTKMKSDVWIREEIERSQAFLRLYRLSDLQSNNSPDPRPSADISPDQERRPRDRSESVDRRLRRNLSPERRERSRSPRSRERRSPTSEPGERSISDDA